MPRYGESPEQMIASLDFATRDVARPVSSTSTAAPAKQQPSSAKPKAAAGKSRRTGDSASRSARPTTDRFDDAPSPTGFTSGGQNRRFTVEAPQPATGKSERPSSRTSDEFPTEPPESNSSPFSFPEGGSLQPTHHQSRTETERRRAGAGLLWERSEETGATPQWAGFPGQTELF